MTEIQTRHLFEMEANLADNQMVGATPYGQRIIAVTEGGSFEGERLRGRVLGGGGDWALARADMSIALDVRATLETDDGELIYVTYGGRWSFAPELFAELSDPEAGAKVDPSRYYFRTNPVFETGSERYAWLNNIIAIGTGRRTATGVAYSVHEVL